MKAESPLRPAVRAVADGGETASVRIDLTPAQARRIRQALEREGWLRVLTKRFNKVPTTHLQPTERLQADLEAWCSSPPTERARQDRITLPSSGLR